MKMPIDAIAPVQGVSNITKFLQNGQIIKGTPKGARAAIVFNKMVKKLGLESKYPLLQDGSKIKYIDLKPGNPTGDRVIGWHSNMPFPKEFGLDKFVNRDNLFHTSFSKPLASMVEACGDKATAIAIVTGKKVTKSLF